MAIKAGAILHEASGFVIDRIQTGGASNLNIPEEKIYELGNWESVAVLRDIPDLSFDLESLDTSTEIEAILTGKDPTATVDGTEFDLDGSVPIDIISPFKSGNNAYDIVKGVAVPYLTLESVTYRFGVRANATEQFTLRGDSIYYIPGTPYYESKTLVNNTLTYSLGHTALVYTSGSDTLYVLSACVKNPTTGIYKRLYFGDDYTNTSTTITLLEDWYDSGYTKLHVVYGSATAASYLQAIHPTTSVKPAAIRSRDIDVYVSDGAATPTWTRWTSVQSFEVTRRVTLENDEEFGNVHYVSQDYDVPEVTGTIALKPRDLTDLWEKIHQISDVASNQIVGPNTTVTLPVELRLKHPDTGDRIKTLYIPDARFQPPPIQGRVQTKLETSIPFSSDSGSLLVYAGERP